MTNLQETLEGGGIRVFGDTGWLLEPTDRALLCAALPVRRGYKNIAYDARSDRLRGLGRTTPDVRDRVCTILRTYGERVAEWFGPLLPAYAAVWTTEETTFRPFEEAGRRLPHRSRNDLLHTDAFPNRPTHGARILRVFTNLHPTEPRRWVTGPPFHELLPQVAHEPHCPRPPGATHAGLLRGALRHLGHRLGLPVAARQPYDVFMLRFHDFLKSNDAFQTAGRERHWEFPPLATWIVFTDSVPHAVVSGQYALEQTFLVPSTAMARPETVPLAVLEAYWGRNLAGDAVPA